MVCLLSLWKWNGDSHECGKNYNYKPLFIAWNAYDGVLLDRMVESVNIKVVREQCDWKKRSCATQFKKKIRKFWYEKKHVVLNEKKDKRLDRNEELLSTKKRVRHRDLSCDVSVAVQLIHRDCWYQRCIMEGGERSCDETSKSHRLIHEWATVSWRINAGGWVAWTKAKRWKNNYCQLVKEIESDSRKELVNVVGKKSDKQLVDNSGTIKSNMCSF